MRAHALRMKLVFWLAGCLGAASVGCGTLDTQDQVHDLRLLSMRAEPPEQVFLSTLPCSTAAPASCRPTSTCRT